MEDKYIFIIVFFSFLSCVCALFPWGPEEGIGTGITGIVSHRVSAGNWDWVLGKRSRAIFPAPVGFQCYFGFVQYVSSFCCPHFNLLWLEVFMWVCVEARGRLEHLP